MNQTEQTLAAPTLRESDLIAWMRAKAAASAIPGCFLKIDADLINAAGTCIAATFMGPEYIATFADTFDHAIDKLKARIAGQQFTPEQLRAQAAKLLNQAASLELELLNANSTTINVSKTV